MTITEICKALGGEIQCPGIGGREITEAAAGDLLSFIMGTAREGAAWVTVQAHLNVAAVAVLKDLPLIIIASGRKAPEDLIERCTTENIAIVSVPDSIYAVCAKLAALGLKG
ncbi:MAG: serine kinase [Synergistaceae bacterium]|nr:serine kinase [Synergistaceae bacterium]